MSRKNCSFAYRYASTTAPSRFVIRALILSLAAGWLAALPLAAHATTILRTDASAQEFAAATLELATAASELAPAEAPAPDVDDGGGELPVLTEGISEFVERIEPQGFADLAPVGAAAEERLAD